MAEGLRGLLPSLAVFAAVLLVVLAPGSQAFKAAGPAHSSALVLRVARGETARAKRVRVSGLTLQGYGSVKDDHMCLRFDGHADFLGDFGSSETFLIRGR